MEGQAMQRVWRALHTCWTCSLCNTSTVLISSETGPVWVGCFLAVGWRRCVEGGVSSQPGSSGPVCGGGTAAVVCTTTRRARSVQTLALQSRAKIISWTRWMHVVRTLGLTSGCGVSRLPLCLLLVRVSGCCSFLEVVVSEPSADLCMFFVALATSASKLNSFFGLSRSVFDMCLMMLFGSKAEMFHFFQLLGNGLHPTKHSMGLWIIHVWYLGTRETPSCVFHSWMLHQNCSTK